MYKFKILSPYNEILLLFILFFAIIFLLLLTLRQVEMGKEKFNQLMTFKYNKFTEIILYFFASFVNVVESIKKRKNLKDKYKEAMYIAIFPVQKYIAVSIAGIEFTNRKDKFITDTQLYEIKAQLEPGDILLKRNDWQATNFGIPGFWTHAGLYIGNVKEMDDYFLDLESLNGKKLSDTLKHINEKPYYELITNKGLNIIEAIEEGVSIKPLSNIAKVDYFCALRPRVSKEIKLEAIKKSFSFVGLPYDYHFDIENNNSFVCSEVVKKAYNDNITLPSTKKLGKELILPNSIAKKYSNERLKKNKQLDFVLFYDLDIHTRKAYKSIEKEFSKSYKRNVFFCRKRDILRYLSTILDF